MRQHKNMFQNKEQDKIPGELSNDDDKKSTQ